MPPADAAATDAAPAGPPPKPTDDARAPSLGDAGGDRRDAAPPTRDAALPARDAARPLVDATPTPAPPDAAPPRGCAVDPRPPRFGARIVPVDAEPGLPLVVDVTADVGLTWVGLAGEGPDGPVGLRHQFVTGNGPFRWRFEGPVAQRGRYCLVFTAGPAADAPEFVAARGFEAD